MAQELRKTLKLQVWYLLFKRAFANLPICLTIGVCARTLFKLRVI
jgi:hypothetical protein